MKNRFKSAGIQTSLRKMQPIGGNAQKSHLFPETSPLHPWFFRQTSCQLVGQAIICTCLHPEFYRSTVVCFPGRTSNKHCNHEILEFQVLWYPPVFAQNHNPKHPKTNSSSISQILICPSACSCCLKNADFPVASVPFSFRQVPALGISLKALTTADFHVQSLLAEQMLRDRVVLNLMRTCTGVLDLIGSDKSTQQ